MKPFGRLVHVLFVFALLACICVSSPAQKARPIFKDGEAQVVPAFKDRSQWIHHDLFVETEFDSDGNGKKDRVHVDVTRPMQTDTEGLKVAVIYETSPYFAGTSTLDKTFFWDPKHEVGEKPPAHELPPYFKRRGKRPTISRSQVRKWVPRGFAVVHSSSPGTGFSQGCPTVGGENESLAPKAVVDWLNGRAKGYTSPDGDEEVKAFWSTGNVGMTGTSYNGTLPLAAATTGVEGLKAIIPIAPNTSYYHYYRSNGLVRHPGGYVGEDIDVLYNFINSGDMERREWCDCNVRDEVLLAKLDRTTGDLNDFWKGRDYLPKVKNIKAAVLMAHAFNDWNVMPEHSVRIYLELKRLGKPAQAFFHQGGHGGEPPMTMMNRWFSRYLYGVKNGVEKDARAWVVREGDPRTSPTPYEDYPNPKAAPVTLHPRAGGMGRGALSTKKTKGQGTESLVDDVSHKGSELAKAEKSPNRLLYVSSQLRRPVHLSGHARIKVRLASNVPAANLSVWLVSLPWEGRRIYNNVITRGWADPQNHASETQGSPLEPGKFYDLSFDMQPDDHVVPAGQRIGLMIFSSDREFTLWPDPGTQLTIDLDHTSIELPVVGGQKAWKRAAR